MVQMIRKRLTGKNEVLGPAKAPIEKLKDHYRYHLVVKGPDLDEMRKAVVDSAGNIVKLGGVRVSVDIDPYNRPAPYGCRHSSS